MWRHGNWTEPQAIYYVEDTPIEHKRTDTNEIESKWRATYNWENKPTHKNHFTDIMTLSIIDTEPNCRPAAGMCSFEVNWKLSRQEYAGFSDLGWVSSISLYDQIGLRSSCDYAHKLLINNCEGGAPLVG